MEYQGSSQASVALSVPRGRKQDRADLWRLAYEWNGGGGHGLGGKVMETFKASGWREALGREHTVGEEKGDPVGLFFSDFSNSRSIRERMLAAS